MAAFSLIALCALVGLAADTGYFFDYKRQMQTAADAAALAGAEQLRRGGNGNGQVVTAADAADVALHPAANIAMVRVHGTSRAASCGGRFVTSLSG